MPLLSSPSDEQQPQQPQPQQHDDDDIIDLEQKMVLLKEDLEQQQQQQQQHQGELYIPPSPKDNNDDDDEINNYNAMEDDDDDEEVVLPSLRVGFLGVEDATAAGAAAGVEVPSSAGGVSLPAPLASSFETMNPTSTASATAIATSTAATAAPTATTDYWETGTTMTEYSYEEEDDPEAEAEAGSPTGSATRPPLALYHQDKQGGICCGMCCDYRRAVVIVGILHIALVLLLDLIPTIHEVQNYRHGVGSSSVGGMQEEKDDDDYYSYTTQDEATNPYSFVDDDELQTQLLQIHDKYYSFTMRITLSCLELLFCVVSMYGAIQFQPWPVAISVMYGIASLSIGIIMSTIASRKTWQTMVDYGYYYTNDQSQYQMGMFMAFLMSILLAVLLWYPAAMLAKELWLGQMSKENYKLREEYSCCCIKSQRQELQRRRRRRRPRQLRSHHHHHPPTNTNTNTATTNTTTTSSPPTA